MKVSTSELVGAALDWAAAKCKALPVALHSTGAIYLIDTPWANKSRIKWLAEFSPTRHWAQGGPIIEREGISIEFDKAGFKDSWVAYKLGVPYEDNPESGPTPLIAAMRCFVASKLGDEIDIPEELT
jgi:hypothetical protein